MANDGISSVNTSTASLVLDSLSPQKNDSAQTTFNSEALVSSSLDAVTISASGKKINELYDELKKIEDPAEREKAMQGFRQVTISLTEGTDSSKMANFIRTMDDLKSSDKASFKDFFTTANTISEEGLGLRSFLDTFLRIEDRGLQKSFIRESKNIVENEEANRAEKQSTFNKFLGTVNNIMDAGLEDEERVSMMQQFFDEISKNKDLESKDEFMDRFAEENLNESSTSDNSSE